MDEYQILLKYGIEVGILGAFLWAFKRVLGAVLNDKSKMMDMNAQNIDVISKNTEAFYNVMGAIEKSCDSQKAFQKEAVQAIKGFQQMHKRHSERDEKMIGMMDTIVTALNGEKK